MLVASGCTADGPAPGVSSTHRYVEAALRLAYAPGVHYRGRIVGPTGPVELELRMTNEGAGLGTAFFDRGAARLYAADGELFLRAPVSWWSADPGIRESAQMVAGAAHPKISALVRRMAVRLRARGLSNQWAHAPGGMLGWQIPGDLAPVGIAEDLAAAIPDEQNTAVRKPRTSIGGVDAVRVDTASLAVFISVKRPHRVLRVIQPAAEANTSAGPRLTLDLTYPSAHGVGALRRQLARMAGDVLESALVFDNGAPFRPSAMTRPDRGAGRDVEGTVALPTRVGRVREATSAWGEGLQFLNLTAPCGPPGCVGNVQIAAASAGATVTSGTLDVWAMGGGGILAHCKVNLGRIPAGGSKRVGCAARSPRWAAFYAAATAPRRHQRITPYFVLFMAFAHMVRPAQADGVRDRLRNPRCRSRSRSTYTSPVGYHPEGELTRAATVSRGVRTYVYCPHHPPTSDAQRGEARRKWQRVTGRSAGSARCQIHHRIPLEWAHLFPGHDPNSLANLVGMSAGDHAQVTNDWRRWKRGLGGRQPTQADVVRQALDVDRRHGGNMRPISPGARC